MLQVPYFLAVLLLLFSSPSEQQQQQQQRKSRYLLLSVDNRALHPNVHDNHYVSMNAVITRAYALHHGYDYIYIEIVQDGLYEKVMAKYPGNIVTNQKEAADARSNVAKDIATAFHVGLKQFRAASWAKLPPLWHITMASLRAAASTASGSSSNTGDTAKTSTGPNNIVINDYDYIWYIDSDATVSPLRFNRTIDDAIAEWEHKRMVRDYYLRWNLSSPLAFFVCLLRVVS